MAGGSGWGEGRELIELVRVVVQYLVHRPLLIACAPCDLELHRMDIRGCDRLPGPGVPAQRCLDPRDELIHLGGAVARPQLAAGETAGGGSRRPSSGYKVPLFSPAAFIRSYP